MDDEVARKAARAVLEMAAAMQMPAYYALECALTALNYGEPDPKDQTELRKRIEQAMREIRGEWA